MERKRKVEVGSRWWEEGTTCVLHECATQVIYILYTPAL